MKSSVIKFRDTEGLSETINRTARRMGLSNNSAAVRLLLRQGEKRIDELLSHVWDVVQDLNLSEIDYFTGSMNVILKKKKRELMAKK